MELHDAHGKAMRIGIILTAVGLPFFHELGGPWTNRQTTLHSRSNITKQVHAVVGGRSDTRRGRRPASSGCILECSRWPRILPDPRKIRLSVRCSRSRCSEVRLSGRRLRNSRRWIVRPLCRSQFRSASDHRHKTNRINDCFHTNADYKVEVCPES